MATGRHAEVSHSLRHVTTVLSHSRNPFLTRSDVWVGKKNEPTAKTGLNVGECVSQLA